MAILSFLHPRTHAHTTHTHTHTHTRTRTHTHTHTHAHARTHTHTHTRLQGTRDWLPSVRRNRETHESDTATSTRKLSSKGRAKYVHHFNSILSNSCSHSQTTDKSGNVTNVFNVQSNVSPASQLTGCCTIPQSPSSPLTPLLFSSFPPPLLTQVLPVVTEMERYGGERTGIRAKLTRSIKIK